MATKKGSPRARGKAPAKGGGNGTRKGNVTLGPVTTAKVRVPIDRDAYSRKESEIAQHELQSRRLRAKIKPDQVQIAEHRKAIAELTADLEDETEERDEKVRHEFHWSTSEVRVLRASDGKELGERRTMTAQELKRNDDLEDHGAGKGRVGQPTLAAVPSAGDSGLPPAEAVKAAREKAAPDDDAVVWPD